jgi:microcystin degradation protein MlrC
MAEAANTDGLVVFADICDNTGAGSSGDGTKLLRAMLDAGVTNAAYAMITDAETVETCWKAGPGSYVDIRLGGKCAPDYLGEPIECRAYVKSLFDGRYTNKGPMQAGMEYDMKKSAVIEVGGISVIVGAIPKQPFDIEIFRSHGLTPSDFHILVVKSSVHYRASFGPHAAKMLPVDCPGILVIDPRQLDYQNVNRPIYPLDKF